MTESSRVEALEIEVKDFGPITRANIDLRKLTVFIGPSNSGKSYLAILIYALHNAWKTGRMHHMPKTFKWLFPKKHIVGLEEWVHEVVDSGDFIYPAQELPKEISASVRSELNSYFGTIVKNEIERCFGTESIQSLIRRTGSRQKATSRKATVTLKQKYEIDQANSKLFTFDFEFGASNTNCFVGPAGMPLHIWNPEPEDKADWKNQPGSDYWANSLADYVCRKYYEGGAEEDIFEAQHYDGEGRSYRTQLGRHVMGATLSYLLTGPFHSFKPPAHYLPADRGGIMHAHRIIVNAAVERATRAGIQPLSSLPSLSGVQGDFVKQLVEINDYPDSSRRNGLLEIIQDLESNVLGGEVRSETPERFSIPEFSYMPSGWSVPLPLMFTSSMVAELSPVVLYLRRVLSSGDILIIEEPEAHLHPKLQVEFVKLLAKLAKAGVRIILTTHSSLVLDTVANFVFLEENFDSLEAVDRQNGNNSGKTLVREDVGLWSFVPKNRPKGTVVEKIEFDPRAGGFPAQLDDAAMNLYNEWASIDNAISEGDE